MIEEFKNTLADLRENTEKLKKVISLLENIHDPVLKQRVSDELNSKSHEHLQLAEKIRIVRK